MTTSRRILTPTVAVIGGGPAGLTAAKKLAEQLGDGIHVYDREAKAGGIPRHADHPGYGIRDRKSFISGPKYAEKLVAEAETAGVCIHTRTMVTGWHDEWTLDATTPEGRILIRPQVFLFATGARERPRPARMIPGDRPAGVYTTGQLQNLAHIHHRTDIGTKAVIVGAELVSWSAALTLKEYGVETKALVTKYPKSESYWLFRTPGKLFFKTSVVTNSRVTGVIGRGRVSGVEVENVETGKRRVIDCDTVIFTGDWIPDNELLRMADIELDPVSGSPITDGALRTSRPGIFAVGNVNHPVETADVVALEGQAVADHILKFLRNKSERTGVSLVAAPPLRWVSPSRYSPQDDAARGRIVSWIDTFITRPKVTITQNGRQLASKKLLWPAAPGRAFRIPTSLLKDVDPNGSDVTISVSE